LTRSAKKVSNSILLFRTVAAQPHKSLQCQQRKIKISFKMSFLYN
jgi:hypothetical protein